MPPDSSVRKFFGTDGVRGPYGGPVINERFAFQLGAAAGRWLATRGIKNGVVLIGRDTRLSGPALERALAAGLAAEGAKPVSLEVLPTPAVSRAVVAESAALGVVITASHNPAADNGIKFFGPKGVKLTDHEELQIERALRTDESGETSASFVLSVRPAVAAYAHAMEALLPAGSLAGWRIVLDTANGATCATSPAVLKALGAKVIGLGASPDGKNINAGVGSEHPEKLGAQVLASGAKLGIAHDGDGDRCVLSDETGSVLDGDELLTILATQAQASGRLVANTLIVTVQSNLGVDAALAKRRGRVVRSAVGDRYVIEKMTATGATLGGESSGHIICSEVAPTGDGLVAALKVIEVMRATGESLSVLRQRLVKFPQLSTALKVKEKKPLETLPTLSGEILALERELGAQGRVLVRFSGTEAKLRLLVEGPTDAVTRAGLARLEKAARADLDVV